MIPIYILSDFNFTKTTMIFLLLDYLNALGLLNYFYSNTTGQLFVQIQNGMSATAIYINAAALAVTHRLACFAYYQSPIVAERISP